MMNGRNDPNEQMQTVLFDLPKGKAIRGGGKNGRKNNKGSQSGSSASVNAYRLDSRNASDDTITTSPSTTLRDEELLLDDETIGNASSISNNNKRAVKSALHHQKQPIPSSSAVSSQQQQLVPLPEELATSNDQQQHKQQSSTQKSPSKNSKQQQLQAAKRRSVHFPKHDKDLISIIGTSRCDSMPTVWWSPKEMETMHEHAFAVVDFFARYKSDYTNAVRSMIAQSAQTSANLFCLRTAHALTHIVGASARGLETCTVEVLQHRRDFVRRQVLRKQHVLRRQGDDTLRAQALGWTYQNLNQYAVLWAQILADGDALEAADSPSPAAPPARPVLVGESHSTRSSRNSHKTVSNRKKKKRDWLSQSCH